MQFKNIKIQVWTDVYYAKFIAIWRPEEEPDYVAPDPDTRTEQEKNVPVLLVQNCVYEAKNQMVGNNPVSPNDHPMSQDFLNKQIRHICYCFANDYCVFQPPTKAAAELFLAKMRVGYTLDHEYHIPISMQQGNMCLYDLITSAQQFDTYELKKIKIQVNGKHPHDVVDMQDFTHTMGKSPPQFITLTHITPVHDTPASLAQSVDLSAIGKPPGT